MFKGETTEEYLKNLEINLRTSLSSSSHQIQWSYLQINWSHRTAQDRNWSVHRQAHTWSGWGRACPFETSAISVRGSMSKGLKEVLITLHLPSKRTEQERTFHCIFIKSGYSHFIFNHYYFAFVVQLLSHIWVFATPQTAACQASLSFTLSRSLLKLMSSESVMPSNHPILYHPFSSCPQSFPASESFPWVSSSHQVTKVLEFQLKYQSFQWIFRVDFL